MVRDQALASTEPLPSSWMRTDEWYNFRSNPTGRVHVLLSVDERTYHGGSMGTEHPIAWCHDFDGGRAWYTAMGHTASSYTEPLFLSHLLRGLLYASRLDAAACPVARA
jgi:type 1 glutamine amidotransferase